MKHWKTFLCVSVLVSFNGCISLTVGANDTESLSGSLVDPQGAPVADALVYAYSAQDTGVLAKLATSFSDSIADSVRTDGQGRFKFSRLKSGDYNLKCTLYRNGDTLILFHRDVHCKGPTNVGRDTLQQPGGILMRTMWGDAYLKGVHCAIVGGSEAAVSDDSGRCLVTHVPSGIFQIQMTKDGFFPAISGDIPVRPGKVTDAGVLGLTALQTMQGCWAVTETNGFYGTLILNQNGNHFTGKMGLYYVNSPGVQDSLFVMTGIDSVTRVYFSMRESVDTSVIGYYWGDRHGDTLSNGFTQSNKGPYSDWSAIRTVCP